MCEGERERERERHTLRHTVCVWEIEAWCISARRGAGLPVVTARIVDLALTLPLILTLTCLEHRKKCIAGVILVELPNREVSGELQGSHRGTE